MRTVRACRAKLVTRRACGLVDHMSMTESNGTTAPGFEGVRDAFDANFAKGLEIGASFSAYHRGRESGRPVGRNRRPRHQSTMGRAHARARLLDDEGRDRDLCQQTRAGRHARPRRAGREVLARIRSGWQGRHPGEVPALAPGRAGVGRRRDDARGGACRGTRSSTCSRNRFRTTSPVRSTAITPRRTDGWSAR